MNTAIAKFLGHKFIHGKVLLCSRVWLRVSYFFIKLGMAKFFFSFHTAHRINTESARPRVRSYLSNFDEIWYCGSTLKIVKQI
jgi:hypothetical protein